jgi:hypothetical protein
MEKELDRLWKSEEDCWLQQYRGEGYESKEMW